MPSTILTRRGNQSTMPQLGYGELAFAQDKTRLFCGNSAGTANVNLTPILYTPNSVQYNPPGGTIPRYTLNGNDTSIENFSTVDFRTVVTGGVLASPVPAYSFLAGYKNTVNGGGYTTVFGGNNIISSSNGFCAGYGNTVGGDNSFCVGRLNSCNYENSFVGGASNSATVSGSVMFGFSNTCGGPYSTLLGRFNRVNNGCWSSLVAGENNATGAWCSITAGIGNNQNAYCGLAIGSYNAEPAGQSAGVIQPSNSTFIIGNGSSGSQRSNCFRVRADGNVYGLAAFNSTGADYAEFFEWEDKNPEHEDRVGRFVTIVNSDMIAFSKEGDSPIGVVSGFPSVIGNSYSDAWRNRYLKDDFERPLYDEVDGILVRRPNPDYVPEETYIPREKRPEWDTIGLLGRIRVIDNGSCSVNSYCTCGDGGFAIPSTNKTDYRVLKRISTNVIEILFK